MVQVIEMFQVDIADRYTITLLKLEKMPENSQEIREALIYQLLYYKAGLDYESFVGLGVLVKSLRQANERLWDEEHEIRKGVESEMSLEEIGQKALNVRDLNRARNRVKNEIIELTGQGFKEMKMNYAGDEDE